MISEKVDPEYDLIIDEDLQKNQWPKKLNAENTSLMSQVMSVQLFEKLKDKKTMAGWTISRAINTGVMYSNSLMGCHAGDKESYYVFREFFDQVIEKHHLGYKLNGERKHHTDMNVDNIRTDLTESAKAKIVTIRIRVARNLAMFPLNPAGTKQTRLEVAKLVGKAVSTLKGDLQGEFYLHTEMRPENRQRLIDDHFLFRDGDKKQAASGYHTDWPHGRGIFHNQEKNFLLWVNEGDHLRVISMEKGGDVKRVFARLGRGLKEIQNSIRLALGRKEDDQQQVFVKDEARGFITCCPSNLGTGMRASVHIRLPKLVASIGFEKLDQIARTMNCQVRGSTGEYQKVVDKIDISNWRRLGFTETSLIEDMLTFINKVAVMEDELNESNL